MQDSLQVAVTKILAGENQKIIAYTQEKLVTVL